VKFNRKKHFFASVDCVQLCARSMKRKIVLFFGLFSFLFFCILFFRKRKILRKKIDSLIQRFLTYSVGVVNDSVFNFTGGTEKMFVYKYLCCNHSPIMRNIQCQRNWSKIGYCVFKGTSTSSQFVDDDDGRFFADI